MTTIDAERTLGDLVAERPQLAAAFERLRLDYCCGGTRTLAEACRQRELDPTTVAVVLERLESPGGPEVAVHDLRRASVDELCDHIVTAHHDRLRRELPQIAELLATVVRVHGGEHRELHDLERLFASLADELLAHVETEERVVFPAARAGAGDRDALAARIAQHVTERARAGDGLTALRELADGYDTSRAYCGTHRRLLQALESFELDLHRHVHEENNLLFPRLLA